MLFGCTRVVTGYRPPVSAWFRLRAVSWVLGARVLGGLRRGAQHGHPLRRVESVPMPLRHDDDHPRRQLEGLRSVLGHDGERRGALQDLDELIALLVALPWTLSREAPGEDAPVPGREPTRRTLPGLRPL